MPRCLPSGSNVPRCLRPQRARTNPGIREPWIARFESCRGRDTRVGLRDSAAAWLCVSSRTGDPVGPRRRRVRRRGRGDVGRGVLGHGATVRSCLGRPCDVSHTIGPCRARMGVKRQRGCWKAWRGEIEARRGLRADRERLTPTRGRDPAPDGRSRGQPPSAPGSSGCASSAIEVPDSGHGAAVAVAAPAGADRPD